MEWVTDPQAWIAFLTLTALEIVLGIDNVIFISILAGKLPPGQQAKARTLGLALAMIILIGGGLFLLVKATLEIHHKIEGHGDGAEADRRDVTFGSVIAQILLLDVV